MAVVLHFHPDCPAAPTAGDRTVRARGCVRATSLVEQRAIASVVETL